MTRQPVACIQSTDVCPSTNPSTSTLGSILRRAAQSHIIFTASNSPSDTRAEATSTRSAFKSSSSKRAIISFSWGTKDTPLVCSPSRSVVSMISIFG